MLVTLSALGSGPASFLSKRFDGAARLAMAPVLGLALGTSVFTTVIWFTPARDSYWLVPVVSLISLAIAWLRSQTDANSGLTDMRREMRAIRLIRRLTVADALSLAVVCVIVAAPMNYTLHQRHSVGPTGFEVWDAFAFTAEADGAVTDSISAAQHKANVFGQNFAQMYWAGTAYRTQQIDAVPLSANMNELLGLHATDTQTLYLVVFLITGALGSFAAVRYAVPRPSWIAGFAGVLFAGPFFLQLVADGSQPAICGLATLLPIAAVGVDALRTPRVMSLALVALLMSGLIALYPLYVPAVSVSAALVTVSGVTAWQRGAQDKRRLLSTVGGVGLVIGLSILFNIVSFLRAARYWRAVLEGVYNEVALPIYHLPAEVLLGWLLQTREFYFLTTLGHAPAMQVITGVILPLAFMAVIAFGFVRRPGGLILLPLVMVCAAMAIYESAAHHCPYCADRTMLPIAPLGVALLALGIAALVTAPRRHLRWAGIAVAVVALISVGERTRQEQMRFADGSYFLESSNRSLLAQLPPHSGSVNLEGFGQDPQRAAGELEISYLLGFERNHGEVSLLSEYTDYSGLAYLTNANPANPQFNRNYRYVLTRLGGIKTGRRLIARNGALALEERVTPLDATLVSGVAVPLNRLDATGLAWVEGPLHFVVVGAGQTSAWVSLGFLASVPVTVSPQAGVQARTDPNGVLRACVRVRGKGPLRRASITLSFPLMPGVVPQEPFAVPEPPRGVELTAVQAVRRCSLSRTTT